MESKIRLLIADIDGTLVTQEKVLTARSIEAVKRLRDLGVAFTITSGRPPLGMKMLIDELPLTAPAAAFNGGVFVHSDLSVMTQNFLRKEDANKVIDAIMRHGLDCWLYTDLHWLVQNADGPHVAHEAWTVKFSPTTVGNFDSQMDRVAKIVGVSDDHAAVARCEADVQASCEGHVSAARSQPYYLDVTHPDANKGHVVTVLSQTLSIPPAEIATIGDMPNDVLMFRKSGISIAMGNADPDVQSQATFVTTSNEQEGFAHAVDTFVLRHDSQAKAQSL